MFFSVECRHPCLRQAGRDARTPHSNSNSIPLVNTPEELVAQCGEETRTAQAEEFEFFGGFFDCKFLAEGQASLTVVEGNKIIFFTAVSLDAQNVVVADDHRTHRQCVRRHRRKYEIAAARQDDGTSRAKRIGGAASRRSNYQAVRPISIEVFVVEENLDANHGTRIDPHYRHFVEGDIKVSKTLRRARRLYQSTCLQSRAPLQNFGEGILQRVFGDVCEESKASAIDAHHRNVGEYGVGYAFKQGAVATNADEQIETFRQLETIYKCACDFWRKIQRLLDTTQEFLIDVYLAAVAVEHLEYLVDALMKVRSKLTSKNSNFHGCLSNLATGIRLNGRLII